jgi:hypothetical protein
MLLDDSVSSAQQRVLFLDVVAQQLLSSPQLLKLSQCRGALLPGIVQLKL